MNFLVFIVFLKKMLYLFTLCISHRTTANQDSSGLKWLRLNNLLVITIEYSKEFWRITSRDIDHPFFCIRISFREMNLLIRYFSNRTRSFSSSLIIRNSNSYFLKIKGLVIKNIIIMIIITLKTIALIIRIYFRKKNIRYI